MRERIEAARSEGFAALSAVRRYVDEVAVADNPDCIEVLEAAARAFLSFCGDAEHGAGATELAASYASSFADRVLALQDDPERAIALLQLAWAHRENAGRAAPELALTLANACRMAEDFAGAERAFDHYEDLRRRPAWGEWRASTPFGDMLAVREVQYERARAMFESAVGNPDGVLHHLRRAQELLRAARRPVAGPAADVLRGAWEDAELGFQLDQVDCYCNFENFARAASAADKALQRAAALGFDPDAFELCLALARCWDPGTSAEQRREAEHRLEAFAGGEILAFRAPALRCLLELATARDDIDAAERWIGELRDVSGSPSFAEVSLETELLLRRHRRGPVAVAELGRQQAVQRRAFDQLLATWRRMPLRPGGNGFLHYLERREAKIGRAHV